ncbi:MAG: fumarylacetoacetate hydrolase family protein [Rickettsiales bacterium]|jgi:fumarylacetoacetate (FAA) hydrolase|nr:fumarylacetoacetate hydrolase family protein [Rickettsiales bacterium]
MKLASLKTDTRDGALVVVSRDLKKAVAVPGIAPTLQQVLERWDGLSPHLKKLYDSLNKGEAVHGAFAFDETKVASPLPRAYQWLDGSAYVNHVELVRRSRGVEMPESFWTDPLMYQGGSDSLLGPREDIPLPTEKDGIDFEAEIAVITDDVPMGVTPEDAEKHIKLIVLVNDVSLRYLAMPEIAKGFGFLQAKPASAFSPVAITPDELGSAWKEGKVHLPLITHYNGKLFGKPHAGTDMVFNFPKLVSHAARTRHLSAGTIIGSGTVSNKDRSVGSSCIVEVRTIEKLEKGESTTPFMKYGDMVRIEMLDDKGASIFGTIEQKVVPYAYQGARKTA